MLDGSAGSTPGSTSVVAGVDVPRLKLEQAPSNIDKAATTDRFRTVCAYLKLIIGHPPNWIVVAPAPNQPQIRCRSNNDAPISRLLPINNMINRSQEALKPRFA